MEEPLTAAFGRLGKAGSLVKAWDSHIIGIREWGTQQTSEGIF